MGVCQAFTRKFKPCRGNAGQYRLCHIHERWYVDTKWLPYILKHINEYVNFTYVTRILQDPFAIYYADGSIPSLEKYLDILYDTGPVTTKVKVMLLYDIATRCQRLQPSAAPNLWKHTLKVNINVALIYNRNFFARFHGDQFKNIIMDALAPLLYNESFEIYLVFVIAMLKYDVSVEECKTFITYTLECIDWRKYKFHEKVKQLDRVFLAYLAYLKKLHITYTNREDRIKNGKEVFMHLENSLITDKTSPPLPFQDELFSVIFHPDNIRRLIPLDLNDISE